MAIINGTSSLIHDPYDPASRPPDPAVARGRIVVMTGILLNAATDSNGSKYHLADLPSNCLMDPGTQFDVENDGFAQIVIGTESDADALIDVAKSGGNTITPFAFGDANHGKRLWEILGLAADPGGNIALWKHAEANATGAGNMPFVIKYITA
ncbi:hypothetical protein [Oceaniglobus trochenteri]|uniref:hypothetical protein n=1 Tax=Oceaniglobus trochenteri TaxID=2763260 RepID=UPI001CFF552B|nr:hypothetical protein [Oceaniglobus trochenteri]